MTRPVYVTPAARIAELVREHGSLRKAADATGVSLGHLCEIGTGRQDSDRLTVSTIRKLGLECGPKFKRA